MCVFLGWFSLLKSIASFHSFDIGVIIRVGRVVVSFYAGFVSTVTPFFVSSCSRWIFGTFLLFVLKSAQNLNWDGGEF